jgi:hypothetical protein
MMLAAAAAAVFTPHGLWIILFWAWCVISFLAAAALEVQRCGAR